MTHKERKGCEVKQLYNICYIRQVTVCVNRKNTSLPSILATKSMLSCLYQRMIYDSLHGVIAFNQMISWSLELTLRGYIIINNDHKNSITQQLNQTFKMNEASCTLQATQIRKILHSPSR